MEELITTTKETLAKLSQALTEKEADLTQREEIVEKRERQIEESTQRCEGLRDIDTITFNVGGQHFMYTVGQIEAHPDSLFACFISERWNKRNKGEDGIVLKQRVFDIARSARLFRYFDDYLRLGQVNVDKEDMELVKEEGNFYGISLITEGSETLPSWSWLVSNKPHNGRIITGGTSVVGFKGSLNISKKITKWKLSCKGKYIVGIANSEFNCTYRPATSIYIDEGGCVCRWQIGEAGPWRSLLHHNGVLTFIFDWSRKSLVIASSNENYELKVGGEDTLDWYIFAMLYTPGTTVAILE